MTEKPFNRSDAESLLSPTGTNNYWVIDDRGIWPKAKWSPALGTGSRIDFEFDSWRPAVMFANEQLPQRLDDLPALPFPFDAQDLAAFMLYGFGALVADHYGDWENGPDQESLGNLSPMDYSRRAVKEAFEACREAQKNVGPYPLELDAKADRARKAYNTANSAANGRKGVSISKPGTNESKISRGRAVASTAELESEMEATAEAARAAHEAWLTAMVRQLLRPASIKEPATSAPVVADGPALLTTAPAWSLKRPKRFQGYGKPLYDLLRSVHAAGQPKPSARDVLDTWKNKPPTDVVEVTDNGLKYYDARGNTKPADLEAIRKAIGRMTK